MLFSVEIFVSKPDFAPETILVVPDNLFINVHLPVVIVKNGAFDLIKAYMRFHPEIKDTLFNKNSKFQIEYFSKNLHDKTVDYICGKIGDFTRKEVSDALYLWANLQIGNFVEPTLS